jgi:MSHA biogenesis protein MshM
MWRRYWNLTRDPFGGRGVPFVATPSHAEAEARLEHAIDRGERLAVLRAAEGLGKTTVLEQVLARARRPDRRLARVACQADGSSLLIGLSEGLGVRPAPGRGRSGAWRALADAVRLLRLQGLGAVFAIDDAHRLADPSARGELDRLLHIDPHPEARFTVLLAGREGGEGTPVSDPWSLAARLSPLTRSEAASFVTEKLRAAGRDEPTFTPRAITRLHAVSSGVPRGLDRLASLALMAGAVQRLEIIPPDVVEGVATECLATDPS